MDLEETNVKLRTILKLIEKINNRFRIDLKKQEVHNKIKGVVVILMEDDEKSYEKFKQQATLVDIVFEFLKVSSPMELSQIVQTKNMAQKYILIVPQKYFESVEMIINDNPNIV